MWSLLNFGMILFLEHLLLKTKCPHAYRMGLWGVNSNHLNGAHQYHVTTSPHTWHAWQCNYKSWQVSKERPVLCYARASAVRSMKFLWQILLMTESNINPCFACSLLGVRISRQDQTPLYTWACCTQLSSNHKADICPCMIYLGYNHSVVDIGF